MIFIVNAENRTQYASYLDDMHRHRKHAFVDQLRWQVPVVGELEVDAYDRNDTTYLLACPHPGGPLLASARLLATTSAHLMSDLFAHACDRSPPSGAHVWEGSRFTTAPQVRSARLRVQLFWQIACGIIEAALLFDIEHLTFTANRGLLPMALNCGWEARRLGPTLTDRDDQITAVVARMTRAGLRNIKQRLGHQGPVIRLHAPIALAA